VVNSNAYALAAQVRELGAEAWMLPTAGDDTAQIAERLEQALRADAVLTSGGVSAGDYDRVQPAFARAGVTLNFWKVAIKPGKPILFGTAGRVPVVGLPGNPVSAFVTFELFVKPALRRMAGHRAPYPVPIEVELEHPHRHSTGRTELARAALRMGPDARLRARLHPRQGSGSLPSLRAVDALVVLPAEIADFAAGERLKALPVRPLLFQEEPGM
jgi:molybdopterin molybdotransferase